MNALGRRIAALIAAQGPISIAEFMTLALHDRDAGYYATRNPLGAAGDFITAPELSQMFGELIGLWLAQLWQDQGRPARPCLVELGPGRGTLLADALRALKLVPEFRDSLEVVLVEASPVLRKVQAETLRNCGVAVRWADSFEAAGVARPLFLVANEFFDALPIRQYVKTERGWCERVVTLDEQGALRFVAAPVPAALSGRASAPLGAVYEVSDVGQAISEDIARAIARHGGGTLIVDYGYEQPGFGETLQAVAGHAFAEVLINPGSSDLSAHVDFRALSEAAARGGAAAYGPVGQGAFLHSLGIAERAERLSRSDAAKTKHDLARLTQPDEMGTLFKALAIVPANAKAPPGFSPA